VIIIILKTREALFAVGKYKQDAKNTAFLMGAYYLYATKKKGKFDKVLRRIL